MPTHAGCLLLMVTIFSAVEAAAATSPSVADYPSIQEAVDANPNRVLFVPAGDYPITEAIHIRGERSGLFDPGRIIQQNAERPIVMIDGATGSQIRDLTLTRAEGSMETLRDGILAVACLDLVVENVSLLDNRTTAGGITLRECQNCRISRCLVRNYMRVSIDDRTENADWGYAFHCTDGTGIMVNTSTGTLVEANRVVEQNLLPTPELKTKHKLGAFAKKNAVKGRFVNQSTWDANEVGNWQQGSGIVVTSPEVSDLTRILGNHVENAAQGIDIHADHVIVTGNLIHQVGPPRYSRAVVIASGPDGPRGMHFSGNVFPPGSQGVCNRDLPP